MGRGLLEAHHAYPKEEYPERAYDLCNGVSLCATKGENVGCHDRIVHSSDDNWKRFRTMFSAYNRRKAIREFNDEHQGEV